MSAHPQPSPAPPSGGRHRLALLFTDLAGSTVLGRRMEAEHYAELLGQLRRVWHEVVARHGGHLVRIQGDGALAVFGYPQSGEDDGRRATESALDIHERVSALRHEGLPPALLPLQMHSGIHAGTLLLSHGDIERGRFDLQGDVPNTSALLSQLALSGQILASLDALGPHANFFELGAVSLGAAVGPLQVRAVLGRGSARRRFEATAQRGLTPFIGRDDAVAALRRFLAAAAPDAPRCVQVEGNAGLGKTRLLEVALQDGRHGCTLLRGSCESYLGAEVLQPFLQMLRSCFGVQADLAHGDAAPPPGTAPAWLQALGPGAEAMRKLVVADGGARGGRAGASGVVGELLGFFAAAAALTPLALVIDDWQWADDASRQLLEALLRLPQGPRIIIASRPRDDGASWIADAPRLPLMPFQPLESDLAVRRWLPHADPFLIARIHDYAGGVPLFLEELCHSVSADSLLQTMEGRGATQTWLATLVASRLTRLPAAQADVVRAAAVVGAVVPLGLLAAACGHLPAPATVQALADADFLYADAGGATLRFKHGITRDAVYEAIGLHERCALHERIEATLLAGTEQAERDDRLEALAYHCRGARHWDGAAHWAERAGDKAMAAFALDRARIHYLAAMEALDRIAPRAREHSLRWCQVANKLGMTCIFDPLSLSDDLSVFERAVVLAQTVGDRHALARALYWLGYMCYGFGRFRRGVTHARQALALAQEAGDQRLAAQIEATLGQILTATCDYDEAIALMDAALSAKQQRSRPGGGVAIGSAYALACKGSVLADRGDFAAAHVCFDEAMQLLDGSTHPVANSVRNWVTVSLVWQGRWQDAERVAAESVRIAENTRALLLLVVCRAAAGFARWAAQGEPAGLAQLRDAVQWMAARRGQFYTSLYYGWLVEACVGEGDIASARHHALHVLQRAREGERLGEAVTCRALARAALARGQAGVAWRWLARAERSARLRGSRREAALNQAAQGQMLRRQGQADAAQGALRAAAAALQGLGMDWHARQASAWGDADPAA